jgi:tetratricopeptide (TPR) repeat protein
MIALVLLVLGLVPPGEPGVPPAAAMGDEAFFRIDYPEAVDIYTGALAETPGNPHLSWRLARAFVCMAEDTTGSVQVRLLLAAEAHARSCIRSDASLHQGHTWLAAALGYKALLAGPAEQVALTVEIEHASSRALAIDPRDDAALSIRGSMFRALGNLSWITRRMAGLLYGGLPEGGYPEGEEALKRAIAAAPDVMRHSYELGVLYLDWGRRAEAKSALEKAASLPVRVAIDRPRLVKIRGLLASLEPEVPR